MKKLVSSLFAVPLGGLVAGALVLAPPAAAHGDEGHARHFPGDHLEPAVDVEGIANTEWGAVPEHLAWDAALWFGYENDPLFTFTSPDGKNPLERKQNLVQNRLRADLTAAVSLFGWLQLGLEVPVLLLQSRDDASAPELDRGTSLGTTGIGDVAVIPKVRVLRQQDGAPFDLAFIMPLTLPTGQSTDYFGEEGFTAAPGVAASREWGPWRAAVNLEHRFREPVELLGLAVGNELLYRGALAYRFDVQPEHPTEVGLGLSGSAATDGAFRGDASPVRNPFELLLDVQHRIWGPVDVFFGGGAAVVAGYGIPDFRLFGGVRLSERAPADHDEDGLVAPADRCPQQAETKNGWQDEDGCPDAGDDDKDGVPNPGPLGGGDRCPAAPEDRDGVQDDDGCPEDDDKDGVADAEDACRQDAEDKDGFEDQDGCPDLDNDKDGIADTDDACDDKAEDKDGSEDQDGCPDVDNDKDGGVAAGAAAAGAKGTAGTEGTAGTAESAGTADSAGTASADGTGAVPESAPSAPAPTP